MVKKLFLIFVLFFIILNNINLEKKDKEIKKQYHPELKEYVFAHKDYSEIIDVLKDWEKNYSDLLDLGIYGESSKGESQYYIKISNECDPGKKIVLITASTHGNEPLSTSVIISYIGAILNGYSRNEEITNILNETTLYFVPVVSPDSYPNNRFVDGVDPNRNFPTLKEKEKQSIKPIKNLQNLFLQIKPNSVLSGHTYGRTYLIPWGDSLKDNPNHIDYKRIVGKMSELSNYENKKASQLYGRPIFGTEIDWYQRNGAFAIVSELGTHQKKPSIKDTESEFNRTFSSFLYFLKESTNILIK